MLKKISTDKAYYMLMGDDVRKKVYFKDPREGYLMACRYRWVFGGGGGDRSVDFTITDFYEEVEDGEEA